MGKKESALNAKQLVAQGYDHMASDYTAWAEDNEDEARQHYTNYLLRTLPKGTTVLDLGCGAGLPTTQALSERFAVVGVDLSAGQLAQARCNVPSAAFVRADMARLHFRPNSLSGIVAFYSLIHLPRDEQPELLARAATWLRPGGLMVVTMGVRDAEMEVDDFFGVPMYWSSFDARTNRRLLAGAGLELVSSKEHTVIEFGEPVPFLWNIARKPTTGPVIR